MSDLQASDERPTAERRALTGADRVELEQLLETVCRAGHGFVTVRFRYGKPILFEHFVSHEPPSRRVANP